MIFKRLLPLTAVMSGVALTALPALGQSVADLRTQYLADVERMENKFIELAEAMDAGMYSWQPMEGVRTVSEVFMLIAAENYLIPRSWGATPPEGVSVEGNAFATLAQVKDKAAVVEHLKKSSTYYLDAVRSIPDSKMSEKIRMFGREQTVQAAIFGITGDMHEHLGQAIAYARMNRVVPPWTARQSQSNN